MHSIRQQLANLLPHVRAVDLIDLAVIVVLLYVALHWLTRRSSFAIVLAIAGIGVLYVIAHYFKMYLTLLVFRGGLIVIALACIVVFQRDIRRGFERLAAWRPFVRRTAAQTTDRLADVLVESFEAMAEKRIGALVVLPGKEPLEGHIRGGRALDGLVSQPLLYSIFHPQSPGHDGAVIMQGNRVARFAAHLPLSENLAEVGRMGTRHTAALGLAELCDACVVVVSEERGTVSLAQDGRLEQIESPALLRERLHRFLSATRERPPEYGRFLTRNTAIAALSVVLACSLWLLLAYRVDTIVRTIEDVPVQFRNVPDGWSITEVAPQAVQVTLSGPERAFAEFDRQQQPLAVSLDAGAFGEGRHEVALSGEQVELPSDLSVREVEPETLGFSAHAMTLIEVPVEPLVHRTSADSGVKKSISVAPVRVRLLVRRQDAKRIRYVLTQPVLLDEINETSTLDRRLTLPEHARLAANQQPSVRITVTVSPAEEAGAEK